MCVDELGATALAVSTAVTVLPTYARFFSPVYLEILAGPTLASCVMHFLRIIREAMA